MAEPSEHKNGLHPDTVAHLRRACQARGLPDFTVAVLIGWDPPLRYSALQFYLDALTDRPRGVRVDSPKAVRRFIVNNLGEAKAAGQIISARWKSNTRDRHRGRRPSSPAPYGPARSGYDAIDRVDAHGMRR